MEGENHILFKSGNTKADSPSLRLEKIGLNKNRLFCTIDCDKGLKVHNLFLIGILKIDNVLYISDEILFPPPSSKRKFLLSNSKSISSCSNINTIHDSWKETSNIFDEYGRSESFYHLTRSLEFTADFEGRELQTCKQDLLNWLNFGPISLDEKIKFGVIDSITELWQRGFFFSSISSLSSSNLLSDIFQRTGESHFLIRLSMANMPFFDLDGIYTTLNNKEPTLYKALIKYNIDSKSKKVKYWLNTLNDKKPSESYSLINILDYVGRTTMWKPLSTDFYDKNGLPSSTSQIRYDSSSANIKSIHINLTPSSSSLYEYSNSIMTSIGAFSNQSTQHLTNYVIDSGFSLQSQRKKRKAPSQLCTLNFK